MQQIELFVGCSPNGEDAESQMVLEYTAKKNSSLPVNIHWMKHSDNSDSFWHGWKSGSWATPFSGFRWGIPEFCGFAGQAIYMDSDMIVLGDLAELWNIPWNDNAIVMGKGGWRFCVSKWNCARAAAVLPKVKIIRTTPHAHRELVRQLPKHPQLQQTIDRQWNNFDGETDNIEDIKVLHYTNMSTQMHLKYAIPRLQAKGRCHWFDGTLSQHPRKDIVELFDTLYHEAIDAGYHVTQYETERWIPYEKASQKNYRPPEN